jgi:hypothetical protein
MSSLFHKKEAGGTEPGEANYIFYKIHVLVPNKVGCLNFYFKMPSIQSENISIYYFGEVL